MARNTTAALVCLTSCLLAAGARAELYQWTDEHGQVHVTDDASKVPTGKSVTLDPQRSKARAAAEPAKPTRALSVEQLQAPANAAPTQPKKKVQRTHVLHFQRAGHEISLDVTLEDRVVCNFKADTGASLNTIPRWAVDELGIEIDPDAPQISVVGIGGVAMSVPVITIASLRVGTVHVENVEMAVLSTMNSGLLGLPFFNGFKVAIDPAEGELRLTEVAPGSVEGVYAGVGAEIWHQRFRQLNQKLAALQKAREAVPSEAETSAQSYLERLDREEARLQQELEELEDRAQAAGVPARLR
jgi:predicted aspartyl protease